MGEELRDVIMSQLRREILNKALDSGKRFDGRELNEYRKIEIHRGVVKTAEGSALVKIGDTMVLVSAKFDIVKPFADRPKEGVMITNAELLPTASPSFEPGPPDENSIELARVVDRAIRSSEFIDLETFYVEEDKVLGLYLDIYVLNHDGNYTDAATLAATASLLDTKMPKIHDGKIIRDQHKGPLNPAALAISTTCIKIGDKWLVDPSRDEELVAEAVLTIATTKEHVCTVQKSKGSLYREEFMDAVEMAFQKGEELRQMLK